jgi:GTPase
MLCIGTKSDLTPVNDTQYDFLISSLGNPDFSPLLQAIKTFLPDGPMLFPEDMYTKQDVFFRISEIIREKVFQNTKEELPHSIYVAVEEADDSSGMLRISAYIYTDSESQKYIMIGK